MANIEEMKERLENLKNEYLEIVKELEPLRENEIVKRFIELSNKESNIKYQLKRLSLEIEREKIKSCNHLFIIGYEDSYFDGHKMVTDRYPYCVKCGLDSKFIDQDTFRYKLLTPLEQEMANLYRTHGNGTYWRHYCDPTIARKIYSDLKNALPNLSDEELLEHFKVSITNYENKEKVKTK